MKALKNDGSIYVEQITAAIAECYEGGDNPSNQSLLELYTFIGQHICRQGEKAFVAHLAEMLAVQFPTLKGFSLRNLRRMRDFYRTYENNPALMEKAQSLSWTQNTVILECCESDEQRFFYIDLTVEQNLSKLALMKAIAKNAFAAASDIETPAENVEPSSAPVGDIFAKAAVDTATSVGTACGSFVTACEPPRQGDRLQRTADIEQISNSIRTNRKTDEPSSLFGHTKPLLNYATPLAVRTDRPKRTREPPPGTQHPQQTSLRFYGLQYVNRQRVQQHTQISA